MNKLPAQIIKRPLLTEKGTQLNEDHNKVLFEVAMDANKIEIRKAVEAIYDVRVLSVRTIISHGKLKRLGRNVGRRPRMKKAIVTVEDGAAIDFFTV